MKTQKKSVGWFMFWFILFLVGVTVQKEGYYPYQYFYQQVSNIVDKLRGIEPEPIPEPFEYSYRYDRGSYYMPTILKICQKDLDNDGLNETDCEYSYPPMVVTGDTVLMY